MKTLILSFLALTTALIAAPAEAQIAQNQARNYQINATHSGSVYSEGLTPPLKQKWSFNFGQPISYPLIADGRVFVTVRNPSGNGTRLVAFNAADGAILWSYILGAYSAWSGLCYENSRVFAINGDGLLRAFNVVSGDVVWSTQLPGQYSFTSAPTVFQGVIYTGGAGSGGTAYAVNAQTGVVLWTASVANGSQSSPAVTSDGVYLSYSCPNVYKLNPANGALIWRYNPGCSGGGGKTPALYNGHLYVREYNPDYIFDSETGGMAGTFISKHIPAFSGEMGFFLNGPKPFGTFGTLEGRNVSNNNSLVWSFAGDGFLQSSMLVVNDYVYVGSSHGNLYAVEAATGNQVWTTNVGASIPYVDEQNSSQPLTGFAAGEGILVIPTSTTLVVYEGDHTPALTWGGQTPAANAYGWNNTPVDIPFTTSANVTVSTPSSPVHFTSEGANQTQMVVVTDQAGNNAFFPSPAVNIDLTAPLTRSAPSGTTGNNGWYMSPAFILLGALDQLSGIQNTFYQLDGGPTQTYVGPFSISSDGSHAVSYWSVDAAGNTEPPQSIEVNIDKTAPVSAVSIAGASSEPDWYRDPAQVTLTASDALNSVASIYYALDGGPPQLYSNPFNISGDGNHILAYWSIDAVGNIEPPHLMTLKVDGSAPHTLFAANGITGNNDWYISPSVEVALAAFDEHVGLANTLYMVDGGPAQTYAGPFNVTGNAEHSISFWSVDKAGNEETHQSRTVKIDNDGPTIQNAVTGPVGNSTYYKGPIQMTLNATDNASGVANIYYRIDGGPIQTYAAPFTVSGDGTHPVDFWSFDVAGNNNHAYTVMIRIDATPPSTQVALSGPAGGNGWYVGPVQVALGATDNLSGMAGTYYAIDGGATQTYSGPFTISTNGVHTVLFWSRDQANNIESQQSREVRIDATAPLTQAVASGTVGTNGWYRGPVQLSLSASDNLSGVANLYYTVDGGGTQTFSAPFTVSAAGAHTIIFWSRDQANNSEQPHSLAINVDGSAPAITAAASPSSGAKNNKPLNVNISGRVTDPVSGVSPNSTTYNVVDEYGVTQPSGSVSLQTDGSYSFNLSLPATRNGNDKDGHLYTVTIRANDRAGNAGLTSTTVKIN
jgi:outer membrane protein assembly factor BamB